MLLSNQLFSEPLSGSSPSEVINFPAAANVMILSVVHGITGQDLMDRYQY